MSGDTPRVRRRAAGWAVVFCALTGCSVSVEHRESNAVAELAVRSALDSGAVQTRLREAIEGPKLHAPFRDMKAVDGGDQMFPTAFLLEHAGLGAYARGSEASRRGDLYLFSPLDNYWPSEYYVNGEQVPFTCGFILQISPAPGGGAEIEAYEYLPWVNAGKHWAVGHSGPGRYLDIRAVEPTVADRNALLTEVRRLLAGSADQQPVRGEP
jgi:hypothetical protein